jgi:hypothetical protein
VTWDAVIKNSYIDHETFPFGAAIGENGRSRFSWDGGAEPLTAEVQVGKLAGVGQQGGAVQATRPSSRKLQYKGRLLLSTVIDAPLRSASVQLPVMLKTATQPLLSWKENSKSAAVLPTA